MFDDSSAPVADDAHQAPAWVGELLRSLPQDDPPIPDDVASRLDAVLATLAATRAAASPLDTPRTLGTSATADSGVGGGATVVPIESATGRRRTNNKRSPLGWIGGLAAAALVVVGGTAIVHNLGQPDTSGPTASGIGLSPGTASITPRYVASGTSYTSKSLPAQVHTLLTRAGDPREWLAHHPSRHVRVNPAHSLKPGPDCKPSRWNRPSRREHQAHPGLPDGSGGLCERTAAGRG